MIEESLLKSNFVGRDGFRWWIGQIPPIESQGEQSNGGGWGNRVKVRIMGYHPYDTESLSNEDLPWAQVLLPATAGTGAANYSTNIKIQPGDSVFGFFLDGDNGQIPVILGCFGRTSEVSDKKYSNPFEPFTGYTNQVKNDGSKVVEDQSNEQNKDSQKSPRSLDPKKVDKLNKENQENKESDTETAKKVLKELSYFNAIGNKIISANSCKSTLAQTMMSEMENLVGRLKIPSIAADVSSEIKRTVDKIQGMANGFVGQMFKNVYTKLVGILSNGLDLLYSKVFAYIYSITPCDPACKFAVAHAAGVLAQKAMVAPVKKLEQGISCASSKSINSTYEPIKKLVETYANNVENYTECSGIEFTAGVLNVLVDEMISNVSPLLGSVTKILSPGFSLENLLRGSVSNYLGSGGGVLDCNQNKKKCSGLTGNFSVGAGHNSYSGNDIYKKILDKMNTGKQVGKAVIYENELPDEVLWTIYGDPSDGKNTVITTNVSGNDKFIRLRDISIVKVGMYIITPKEVMTVKQVNILSHVVIVSRTENHSYMAGTTVKVSKKLPSNNTNKNTNNTSARNPTEFEQLIGAFDVFNGKTKDSSRTDGCYTGPPLSCSSPIIKIFGGGGYGAKAKPLLGNYKMKKNGKMTGSIIGVEIQNSGVGYRYPPYIQFLDSCDNGYGAIAKAGISTDGRLQSAYMVSIGENYPVSEVQDHEVIGVIVENGGENYLSSDIIVDDLGNKYESVVDENTGEILAVTPINIIEVNDLPNLTIDTETGSGASLRPILGSAEFISTTENVPQAPDPLDPIVVQILFAENPTPPLDPFITRAKEKARLRRKSLQDKVNFVKDCPT